MKNKKNQNFVINNRSRKKKKEKKNESKSIYNINCADFGTLKRLNRAGNFKLDKNFFVQVLQQVVNRH